MYLVHNRSKKPLIFPKSGITSKYQVAICVLKSALLSVSYEALLNACPQSRSERGRHRSPFENERHSRSWPSCNGLSEVRNRGPKPRRPLRCVRSSPESHRTTNATRQPTDSDPLAGSADLKFREIGVVCVEEGGKVLVREVLVFGN